jgi:hypothetical protein
LCLKSLEEFLPEEDMKKMKLLCSGEFEAVSEDARLGLMQRLDAMSDMTQASAREVFVELARFQLIHKRKVYLLNLEYGLKKCYPALFSGLGEEVFVAYRAQMAPTGERIVRALFFNYIDEREREARALEERVVGYLQNFLETASGDILTRFLVFVTGSDVLPPDAALHVHFDSTEGLLQMPRATTCSKTLTLTRKYICFEDFEKAWQNVLKNETGFDTL